MRKKSLFIVLLIIISSNGLFSQFTGYGNDQRFQAALRELSINQFPPIEQKMNEKTKKCFLEFDSLCRYYKSDISFYEYLDSDLKTFKYYLSLIHNIKTYSTFLIRSYIGQVIDITDFEKQYNSYPSENYWSIIELAECKFIDDLGLDFIMTATAGYIYKVRIDSVIIGDDTTYIEPDFSVRIVNTSASVLERMKGKRPLCNCKIENYGDKNTYQTDEIKKECINFYYYYKGGAGNIICPGMIGSSPRAPYKTVKKGESYFVFLKTFITDFGHVLYPIKKGWKNGGLFPIVDGKVIDEENIFGLGTNPTEDVFIQKLNYIIEEINSWVDIPLNVKDQSLTSGVIIHPNPATSQITLTLGEEFISAPEIDIIDYLGNVIRWTPSGRWSPSDKSITINTSSLSPGVYFLRVRCGEKVEVRKFVVVR